MNSAVIEIPFWNKYLLTIAEAAQYFGIGEKKIRRLVDNGDGDFSLKNGTKTLINRKLFEKYVDRVRDI